jgi:phosphatase NudJ
MIGRSHNVGAIVRRNGNVLLVAECDAGSPAVEWVLPGGRVEQDETLTQAVTREVLEETGLRIQRLGPLAYVSQTIVPDADLQSTSFVFEVDLYDGEIGPVDPDRTVIAAEFHPIAGAITHLAKQTDRMSIPAVSYLSGAITAGAVWYFERKDGRDELVARIPGLVKDE